MAKACYLYIRLTNINWQGSQMAVNTLEQALIKDLRAAEIFAGLYDYPGLSDYELGEVAKICTLHTYQVGQHCAVQGKTTDELGIVREGKAAVEMRLEIVPYTQTITFATLLRGNVYAWSALVEPHVLTASVRCIDEVQTIQIAGSDLRHLFKERPSIQIVMMRNLAIVINSRLRDSRAQLVRLVSELIAQGKLE